MVEEGRARNEIVERLALLEDERYGQALLRLLRLAGWEIAITRRFGGGVVVALRKPGVGAVSDHGESVAVLAPELFTAAVRLQRDGTVTEPPGSNVRVRRDGSRLRLVF